MSLARQPLPGSCRWLVQLVRRSLADGRGYTPYQVLGLLASHDWATVRLSRLMDALNTGVLSGLLRYHAGLYYRADVRRQRRRPERVFCRLCRATHPLGRCRARPRVAAGAASIAPAAASPCVICLDAAGGSYSAALTCGHAFHLACIGRWFQEHTTCPLCRATAAVAQIYKPQ